MGYFTVGKVMGDVAAGGLVTSTPVDKVGDSRAACDAVVAGTTVACGESGRFALIVMRVTVIVPTSPINAAMIEGSILCLRLGDLDMMIPGY